MVPLITGGCGFIGSHLGEHYTASGQRVMVLDDLSSGKKANLIHPDLVALTIDDIADASIVAPLVAQASVVFHLAAIASVPVCTNEPERAYRTNVTGTQVIFDAVAKAQETSGHAIPVIYASSAAIYGNNPNMPLRESATPSPINNYGTHKLEDEHIAERAFARHQVPSVGLRFFNVYGPRQDPTSPYSGVISKFTEAANAGRNLVIFGDGEQTRDFIYVGDVVRMLVAAAASARGAAVYNVCTGTATSLTQLAAAIIALSGHAGVGIDHHQTRLGDIRHSLGDPSTIAHSLGGGNWTPLAHGLKETLGAYA